jgi:hypothetical protein
MQGASAMNENLNGISRKVASMLRRLGDGTDRDILLTIHMLRQVLITAGTDIHAVADRIEEPPSQKLTAAEVQAIYDKGFADGHSKGAERSAQRVTQPQDDGHLDTSDVAPASMVAAVEIAQHCGPQGPHLSVKDRILSTYFGQIALRGDPHRRARQNGCAIFSISVLAGRSTNAADYRSALRDGH